MILIDNRSPKSPEIAQIAASYPSVRFMPNSENLGFAAGMNQGVLQAAGQYVLLSEDDIVLHPHCVEEFANYAETGPNKGIASGILLNKREGTVRCAGATLKLGAVFRQSVWRQGELDFDDVGSPYQTDYVPGCMIFAETAYLRKLGPFRAEFFMYFEDTELCLRVRSRIESVMVVPSAKAWHFEPESAAASDEIDFHRVKNFYALYVLHAHVRIWPQFFLRSILIPSFRSLFQDRRQFRILLRAAVQTARSFRALMADRRNRNKL